MKKVRGVYLRHGIACIRYQDEQGRMVRESTRQRSLKVAEEILHKRKAELAMRVQFPTRRFDVVRFGGLLDYWWKLHGQHTRSNFDFIVDRIRERFGSKKARDVQPDDVQEFLEELRNRGLSASTLNHHRAVFNAIFNFAIKRGKWAYDQDRKSTRLNSSH